MQQADESRSFIVAGTILAKARATTHAVQSNWKRGPNFLACELSSHSVGRCVYYASRFYANPLPSHTLPSADPVSMHSLTEFQFFPGGAGDFFVSKYSICLAKRIHFGLALIPMQHTHTHAHAHLYTQRHTHSPEQRTLSQRCIAVNPKPSKISTIYCSSLAKLICHTM